MSLSFKMHAIALDKKNYDVCPNIQTEQWKIEK